VPRLGRVRSRSRLRRPRAPAGGGGGAGFDGSILPQTSWFEYQGAIRVSHVGINGENRNGRGLTGYDHGATRYMVSTSSGPGGFYAVYAYQLEAVAPIVGTGYDWAQYNVVTADKVFDSDPYIDSSGRRLIGISDGTGDNGLSYDSINDTFIATYSEGYGSNYGNFCACSLNFTATTAEATAGRFRLSTSGMKAYSSGVMIAPADLATEHFSGYRHWFWSGRNQSIITQNSAVVGLTIQPADDYTNYTGDPLTINDAASPGGGSGTTITTALGTFPADTAGKSLVMSGAVEGVAGTGWISNDTFPRTCVTRDSATQITINSTATGAGPASDGFVGSTGTNVTAVTGMGFYPQADGPGAGRNRMIRPTDLPDLVLNGMDSWGLEKFCLTDNVDACCMIDVTIGAQRYLGIWFAACMTLHSLTYIRGDIYQTGSVHSQGIVDPMDFAQVSGDDYYNVQPAEFVDFDLPSVDKSASALAAPVAVTSVTGTLGKFASESDGCVVNAPSHGITPGTVYVVVTGADRAEYNLGWDTAPIDANNFYIYQPNNSAAWSGVASSNAGIEFTVIRPKITRIHGAWFFPDTRMLMVQHQANYGSGASALQTLLSFFYFNPPAP
jgi:hypothetical protein